MGLIRSADSHRRWHLPAGRLLPSGVDGIAAATEDKRGYRVMERKDATHVLVYVHGRIVLIKEMRNGNILRRRQQEKLRRSL